MATPLLNKRYPALVRLCDRVGRAGIGMLEAIGRCGGLFAETFYWLFFGRRLRQPVRLGAITNQIMEIGIHALPIVTVMAGTIGVMLAIQGTYTLGIFGAESHVVIGISLSVTREFAPLITAILVAGRSGSALAARIGTMKINQEVDALHVMGINPVRYLAAPPVLAMIVILPCLTFYSIIVGLFAGGLYVNWELDISLAAYAQQTIDFLSVDDLMHGLGKSVIFAALVALIGVTNGASVTGGAAGVGQVTTRAVVQSILAIVVTDMLFVLVVTG